MSIVDASSRRTPTDNHDDSASCHMLISASGSGLCPKVCSAGLHMSCHKRTRIILILSTRTESTGTKIAIHIIIEVKL